MASLAENREKPTAPPTQSAFGPAIGGLRMTESLYRDYDQDGLDAQLNLRARWPDHPQYFTRWATDSRAARESLTCALDLSYGPTAGQSLDLFPSPVPAAPLLAFIHGGYWQALDKGDFSYLAPPFVGAGIAYASLNYDLAPAASIGTIVEQIEAALVWLYRNAADHGVDPERIFVAGHSAGGHLAACALSADWAVHDSVVQGGLPADLVKGACSVSGVYELEAIRLSYHQEVVKLDPETVARHSPQRQLPTRSGPLICAVGSAETEEFLRQQDEYLAARRAAGLPSQVVELPERNHFSAIDALGERDHPLFHAVCDMISPRGRETG